MDGINVYIAIESSATHVIGNLYKHDKPNLKNQDINEVNKLICPLIMCCQCLVKVMLLSNTVYLKPIVCLCMVLYCWTLQVTELTIFSSVA